MTQYRERYDDAELAALALVREAIIDGYSDASRTAQFYGVIGEYAEVRRGPVTIPEAVIGLVMALSRLVESAWIAALATRLGHWPSEVEMLAEVERFEMGIIARQQDDEDE